MDKFNILVIDDSEDDRLLYRRTLQKVSDAPYRMSEAEDGEAGLMALARETPACVLLDYSLPGRNGIEVLKRIRSKHPFVPVVMLTGQGNEAVAVTAIHEGAQNYIAKAGITPDSFGRVIRIAIEHCALKQRIHEQRASLEIFTRALAHDLKEPVRTIRSFLDLTEKHEQLSEKGQGYFTYIRNAADRMNTLIDTVYFYTRLEGGEKALAQESCDVGEVLADVKDNLGELIRERRATITADALPQLRANRIQLIQLLQNLICNAIRHCAVEPVIHLCVEEGVGQWLFRLSDNGEGISEAYRDHIFEPFKRLSPHKEQGLGLGLAICKKIVESHGGKIWYESRATTGTTFLFTLPKSDAATEAAPKPGVAVHPMAAKANGKLASLLLVDDNDADIELARIMLVEDAHLHCNLLVARDGQQALEVLHQTPVDLMLLDINMPGMDGFELLTRMRENSGRHVPVVMCTTSTYDKDMERARTLGVAGYLNKPAEFGRLKAIIEQISGLQLRQEGYMHALLKAA